MASIDEVTVRQSKPGDEKYILEFAARQSWDYTMYDYRCYVRIDPSGLLVAVDNTDTPIGFMGLSLHTPDLYYLGHFIVREDLRNKGIGRKLWKAMLEKAGDKNIALDGLPAMVDWYKDNGYNFHSFKTNFYVISISEEMKQGVENKYNIVPLSNEHWPSLIEYDRLVYTNLDRERILKAWFTDEVINVYVAFKEGKVVGYGSIHEQPNCMFSLRNVYADSEEILEEILREMFANVPVGAKARYKLLDSKPLPKYLKSAEKTPTSAQRLYNKAMIETNTDRMWFCTAHIL